MVFSRLMNLNNIASVESEIQNSRSTAGSSCVHWEGRGCRVCGSLLWLRVYLFFAESDFDKEEDGSKGDNGDSVFI